MRDLARPGRPAGRPQAGAAAADRGADAAQADLAGRVVLDLGAPVLDRRQRFGEPALAAAIGHYRAALAVREAELAAIEAELMPWAEREPLAGPVARLGCYRGIAELSALTLAAEVVDWRRFPAARMFMSYTGLVPARNTPPGSGPAAGTSTRPAPSRSSPR